MPFDVFIDTSVTEDINDGDDNSCGGDDSNSDDSDGCDDNSSDGSDIGGNDTARLDCNDDVIIFTFVVATFVIATFVVAATFVIVIALVNVVGDIEGAIDDNESLCASSIAFNDISCNFIISLLVLF